MGDQAAPGKSDHPGLLISVLPSGSAPEGVLEGAGEDWSERLEDAAREVFQVMLNRTLGRREDSARAEPALEHAGSFDLCAMVGLAGRLCGVLSLRCSKACGLRMASVMLGTEAAASETDLLDACGELCNMVAGSFKSRITGLADGCLLSPPTVIEGKNYQVHSLTGGPCIQVTLDFESHPFSITLDLCTLHL